MPFMDKEILSKQAWIKIGYDPWVSEALEGRELSWEKVSDMTTAEILDEVFQWYGFIGLTEHILHAVDNVRWVRRY